MFEKYDQYLSLEFSDDYWSDEGISYAASMLNTFTEADWVTLKNSSRSKSAQWIARCAETLGDSHKRHSLDLLLSWSQSGNHEIVISALDSINALSLSGLDISLYSDQLRAVISEIKVGNSPPEKMLLSSLQKKLGSGR